MEDLFTRKQAAAMLGISLATLDAARAAGQIAFVQYVPGGCVYFTEDCLREYIARSTHQVRSQRGFEGTHSHRRNRRSYR